MQYFREVRAIVEADTWYSLGSRQWRFHYRLTHRALYYQRVLRYAEFWARRDGVIPSLILLTYKVRLMRLTEHIGMAIPRGTCAPGLSVAHTGGIVINGGARLGRRCRISQGVTVGAGPSGVPTIGADVFFGPNSQAIGGVRIGDGATILPGAVVVADVPPGAVAGGVPAKVVTEHSAPWHTTLLARDPWDRWSELDGWAGGSDDFS